MYTSDWSSPLLEDVRLDFSLCCRRARAPGGPCALTDHQLAPGVLDSPPCPLTVYLLRSTHLTPSRGRRNTCQSANQSYRRHWSARNTDSRPHRNVTLDEAPIERRRALSRAQASFARRADRLWQEGDGSTARALDVAASVLYKKCSCCTRRFAASPLASVRAAHPSALFSPPFSSPP